MSPVRNFRIKRIKYENIGKNNKKDMYCNISNSSNEKGCHI